MSGSSTPRSSSRSKHGASQARSPKSADGTPRQPVAPREARPPRPPRPHRPQSQPDGEPRERVETPTEKLADTSVSLNGRRSPRLAPLPDTGYPSASSAQSSAGRACSSAGHDSRISGIRSSAPTASSTSASAGASPVSGSRASSSISTRAPSPSPAIDGPRSSSTVESSEKDGHKDAPVRWKWRPQDSEHQLREQGLGSGHLKGRRSNLARIREIQGLRSVGE